MVDFTAQLVDLDGQALKEPTDEQTPVTLGRAASSALVQPYQDEASLPGAEKVQRWQLACRVRSAAALDLPAEDIALIKKCVAKMYSPLIVGQAWQMLDPPKGQ
jgi:hypothetical protein